MPITRFSEATEAALFEALAHGDEEHRAWLKEAIHCFSLCRDVPPATGKGTKESAHAAGHIAGLAEALEMTRASLEYYGKNHPELKELSEEISSRISSLTNQEGEK